MPRHREQRPTIKYRMREKAFSIGDDSWIEDEHGNKAFKVNGKAMRVRDTWVLEDPAGNEVAMIREKKLSVRDKIKIEYAGGVGHACQWRHRQRAIRQSRRGGRRLRNVGPGL